MTPEERGDTWLYQPLYKKPSESWDNFGREPNLRDFVHDIGQLALEVIKYILDVKLHTSTIQDDEGMGDVSVDVYTYTPSDQA